MTIKQPDWEAIKRAYRAGFYSVEFLASSTAAVMAARACGLFFQQVEPNAAEA